ncbi:MAG: DUF2283 domain-containing protein [Spirochaetaceae bacterium]|nr:DUF2283 domain-containing protein [Spirochaetaceae bacterium]
MNATYFEDTDTLYLELSDALIVDTRDLDENTLVEFDANGELVALTIENARERNILSALSYEQVPA